MAEHALSTPAPTRAAESRAHILAALIALTICGLGTPDPVTTGHPTAIEAVR